MSKRDKSIPNEDYVKFHADKNKKKDTVRHLKDKVASMERSLVWDIKWEEDRRKRIERDKIEIQELRAKIYQLENEAK